MPSDSAPPQDAPAPFSGAPDPEETIPPADFILRSGDGVDLHVHRDILKFVSVFFKNMLDGAGHQTDLNRDGKPVVMLPEPSAILYRLLCIAYPSDSLKHYSLAAQTLDGVWLVYTAANKYLFTRAEKMLKEMLETPALLDAHPHRIFAIARLCDLPDLARTAALHTLKSPVSPPGLVVPEVDLITGKALKQLYDFHHSCGIAAKKIADENIAYVDIESAGDPRWYIGNNTDTGRSLVWWENGRDGFHNDECGPCGRVENDGLNIYLAPAQWFRSHVARFIPQLRALPTRQTVEAEALKVAPEERAVIDSCPACHELADWDLASFTRQLAERIEESNLKLGQCHLALYLPVSQPDGSVAFAAQDL
ncbi:hypothetical protein FB451DRAFT_1561267 [Mycena latifolia]|nr:hypothetical protein FB451DRAFT_1561267 [Mycena latifolia]